MAGVWVPAYVLEKARMGSALEVSGRPAEVQVAAYAHDVIRRVIQDGWCRQRELKRRGQRSRRDFAVGVIEGFRGQPLPLSRRRGRPPRRRGILWPPRIPAWTPMSSSATPGCGAVSGEPAAWTPPLTEPGWTRVVAGDPQGDHRRGFFR